MTSQQNITDAFSTLNEEMLERQTKWAIGRKAAVKELQKSNPRSWDYDALFSAAGGKGWYNALNTLSNDGIVEYVKKNIASTIAKRDAKIIAALSKKGITEIKPFTLIHTSDGSEGSFLVDGTTVTIRTILAGGYNIQCLHQRTTVKVG